MFECVSRWCVPLLCGRPEEIGSNEVTRVCRYYIHVSVF